MKNTIILTALSILILAGCDKHKNGEDIALKLLVLNVVGDVKSGATPVKTGDILKTGDQIATAAKSYVELQMLDKQSSAVMRIQASTAFVIHSRKLGNTINHNTKIDKGGIQFRVNKATKDLSFNVTTPTAVASVRGTAFSVSISDAGKSKIQVIDGKVAVRPSLGKIEDLPSSIQEQSDHLANILRNADKSSIVLESGKEAEVSIESRDEYLKKNNLSEFANSDTIQKAIAADPKVMVQSIKSIETTLEKAPIQFKSINTAKTKDIPASELKRQNEEFQDLEPIPTDKIDQNVAKPEELKKILASRNTENKVLIQQRIEKLYNKSFEKLKLKDGSVVAGIVSQSGGFYIVVTPNGVLKFPESEVLGAVF